MTAAGPAAAIPPDRSPSATRTATSRSKATSARCASTPAPHSHRRRGLALHAPIRYILAQEESKRTKDQNARLLDYFLTYPGPRRSAPRLRAPTPSGAPQAQVRNSQRAGHVRDGKAARYLHPPGATIATEKSPPPFPLSSRRSPRTRRPIASASRAGSSPRSTRSPRASPSIDTGSFISERASSRPPRISAPRATSPSTANCSIILQPNLRPTGTSRPCSA